jgi:hypothetical protein
MEMPDYKKDNYSHNEGERGQKDDCNQQQTAEGEKAGHHYRIGHNIIFRYLFTPYRRNGRRK